MAGFLDRKILTDLSLRNHSRNVTQHFQMRLTLSIIIVFFASCSSKKNAVAQNYVIPTEIYGEWKVTELNIFPFEHFKHCGKLSLGTVFQFSENRQFKVFDAEMTQLCNHPQSF